MKLIEPKVELWSEENISPESHIAHCARVCYSKEYKASNQEADKKMVDGLIKRGHLSMLRHSSVYYSFPYGFDIPDGFDIPEEFKSEYVNKVIADNEAAYISTNRQFIKERVPMEYPGYSPSEFLEKCQKEPKLFSIFRLTFCITTQIGTSRELNRKSPNAIAERSTRYCSSKDGIEICKPWWFKHSIEDITKGNCTYAEKWYYDNIINTEEVYKVLLDTNMKPEDARGILPLDTATKVIYTYSIQEWQHILDLRLYDKTGPAHPDVHVVMQMVKYQINAFAKAHNIDYQIKC